MPTSPGVPSSTSLVPQSPAQADPSVVKVMQAIKDVETQGHPDPYNAVGDSGNSHGAFQFNKDNYKNWAKQYGLDANDFSSTGQNKVAYARIADLKQQGHDPEEIAALWNGAHVDPSTKKYTYNNPEYGVKFRAALQGSANQGNTQNNSPTTPIDGTAIPQAQASTGQPATEQSFGSKALDVAKNVGNFLFPIAGDIGGVLNGSNTKTPTQILGDTALSALPFIPFAGEAGEGARGAMLAGEGAEAVAPGLLSKLAGSTVAKGLASGYVGDVGQNLSEGKTNIKDILTPGLGTVTGGALGVGEKALAAGGDSLAGRMVNSLIKPLKKDFSYGKNPGRAVAEEGITGNSLDDLASNIGARRQQIGAMIGKIGDALPNLNINLTKVSQYDATAKKNIESHVLKPLDDALQQAAKTNNPAMFTRLQQTKKALTEELTMGMDETGAPAIVSKGARSLGSMTYKETQALKQQIGDMTQWTGNPTDDKAINAALQNVWRNISSTQKASIGKLNPALRTKLEQLNQRYGDLTSAEIATKYREAIHGRQNLISLGDKIAGGAGLIGGFMSGGPLGSAIGSAALTGLNHAAGTTAVKSRVASGLARMGGARSVLKRPPGAATRVFKGLLPSAVKTTAIRKASESSK